MLFATDIRFPQDDHGFSVALTFTSALFLSLSLQQPDVDSLPRCLLAASGPSAASRCRHYFSINALKKRWRHDLRKVVRQFLRITENNMRAAEAVVPRIQFGLT